MALRRHILAIDIGGTHVKFRVSNRRAVHRFDSSKTMTPLVMVRQIRRVVRDLRFDRITLGYPGMVIDGRIVSEPANLGRGWVGFDFSKAFHHPTLVVNDAVMQALGGYEGGRMLFLGFGTALGAVAILDSRVFPMELAHLPFSNRGLLQDYVGDAAMHRLGRARWSMHANKVIKHLGRLLEVNDILLGGGNACHIPRLPKHARLGDEHLAFVGGFRLWRRSDRQTV